MRRQVKPVTIRQARKIDRAVELLRESRDLLEQAGSVRALERTRTALASAEAAQAQAMHRMVPYGAEL